MSDNIDYKRLLKEYMRHVISCDGTDFIDCIEYNNILSDKDIDLLFKVRDEIDIEDWTNDNDKRIS